MLISDVRKLYQATPFRPFIIHMADGRQISVYHRDFIIGSPNGLTVVVYQPDGAFDIIDVELITSLQVLAPATAAPSN